MLIFLFPPIICCHLLLKIFCFVNGVKCKKQMVKDSVEGQKRSIVNLHYELEVEEV